jgi:hypothetical protein
MSADTGKEDLTKHLSPYRGFVFRWQRYKQLSPQWDHDHFRCCWARFAERPEEWQDSVYTESWVTLWPVGDTAEKEAEAVSAFQASGKTLVPSPKLNRHQLDWLCPKCFEATREQLGLVIDPEHPQWQRAGA